MTPKIARTRNSTYLCPINVDFSSEITIKEGDDLITLKEKNIPNIVIGKIPIMVRSKYLGGEKRIYSIKNGREEQIDVKAFENNELVRKKKESNIKLPTKIRIPIQFGFEQRVLEKKEHTSCLFCRVHPTR